MVIVIPNHLMLGRAHNWLRIHLMARFAPQSAHAGDPQVYSTKRVSSPDEYSSARSLPVPHLMASRKAFFLQSGMFIASQFSSDNSYIFASFLSAIKKVSSPIKLIEQIIRDEQHVPFGANPADADLISYLWGYPQDATADRIYTQSLATLLLLTEIAHRLTHVHRPCALPSKTREAFLLGSAIFQERERTIDGKLASQKGLLYFVGSLSSELLRIPHIPHSNPRNSRDLPITVHLRKVFQIWKTFVFSSKPHVFAC